VKKTLLAFLFASLSLSLSAAHAEEPKLAGLTKQYADKHGLPVRIVKSDLGTRQVERHFVPVLPTTHDDFLATFQEANGAMVWRTGADKIHGAISFKPGDVVSYNNRHGDFQNAMPHASGGHYVALALNPDQIKDWNGFIDKYAAGGTPWSGMNKYTVEHAALKQPTFGGCMWWFVHTEIGGKNLAHIMGVRRAKGPEVLGPRFIHAGNELVGPIGIPVANIEQFNAMTDQQLLGPEPAGGAAEHVKE